MSVNNGSLIVPHVPLNAASRWDENLEQVCHVHHVHHDRWERLPNQEFMVTYMFPFVQDSDHLEYIQMSALEQMSRELIDKCLLPNPDKMFAIQVEHTMPTTDEIAHYYSTRNVYSESDMMTGAFVATVAEISRKRGLEGVEGILGQKTTESALLREISALTANRRRVEREISQLVVRCETLECEISELMEENAIHECEREKLALNAVLGIALLGAIILMLVALLIGLT